MALFDEWRAARAAEASGLDNGTRATYMEWLMERLVISNRALLRVMIGAAAVEEDAHHESEDTDRADPE